MRKNEMLLSYLYENFHEEAQFLKRAHLSVDELSDLTNARIMPNASYVLAIEAKSTSFVSEHQENKTYRFHLKGHTQWAHAIKTHDLSSESRARSYFEAEYNNTMKFFFSGAFGKTLTDITPQLAKEFDGEKFGATWNYFLDGVYGVCTRDGMPKNVFLKQVYALFIDLFINALADQNICENHRETLAKTVNLLDAVESEFAAHEVYETSRQRCIIDIRARYLKTT